jgi:hypothetical protein
MMVVYCGEYSVGTQIEYNVGLQESNIDSLVISADTFKIESDNSHLASQGSIIIYQ